MVIPTKNLVPNPKGYLGIYLVTVETEVGDSERFINRAIKAGANKIKGLKLRGTTVGDWVPHKETINEAMKNARIQAVAVAEAFGKDLG